MAGVAQGILWQLTKDSTQQSPLYELSLNLREVTLSVLGTLKISLGLFQLPPLRLPSARRKSYPRPDPNQAQSTNQQRVFIIGSGGT